MGGKGKMNCKRVPILCTVTLPLLLVLSVGKIKSQLKRISAEENERIQRFCENPNFASGVKFSGMVIGGRPLQPGEYPWAVSLSMNSADGGSLPFCGGTLISQRHILTARHCIEDIAEYERDYGTIWWIQVGGVCARVNAPDGCRGKDMFDVPYGRAIYPYKASAEAMKRENSDPMGKIEHSLTDFAIVELAADLPNVVPLKVGPNKRKASGKVQIACLPYYGEVSPKVRVYGWGNTKRDVADGQDGRQKEYDESNPSAHLLEIEMAPLEKEAIEADEDTKKRCDSDKLICMQSLEVVHTKDGAKGDSGTGIVGRQNTGGSAYVEAITIAGIPSKMINIGLTTHSIAREICFYTGICIERFWDEKGEQIDALASEEATIRG